MIKDRQQGQPASRRCGGSGDPLTHFRQAVVWAAVGLMVQVMKLGDRSEAGFEALHLDEGGYRLDIVRFERIEKPVHERTPGPKAVSAARATLFRHAGHGALKGMAVQVRGGWDQNVDIIHSAVRDRTDRGNPTILIDPDASIRLPTIGGKHSPAG